MYSLVSSVILLYICFAVDTTNAADNGYIVYELPDIPCKDPSSVNSTCSDSIDYKIPDFSNIPNHPDTSTVANSISFIISILGAGGEECRKAGAKYYCQLAYPFRCEEAYVETDVKKIQDSCDEGRRICSSSNASYLQTLFSNCSSVLDGISMQQARIPRKLTCKVFPVLKNDPYSCNANYKVVAENATVLNMAADRIAFLHRMLKSSGITDVQCEKNVADALCKVSIPACSKDQTKIVSILSKQDCRQIVGCVNKTNQATLIQETHALCDGLPDGTTAKKYPLANVYDNKAVGHAMAFSTILFIATLVGSSFY